MKILLVEDFLDLQKTMQEALQRLQHEVLALSEAEQVDPALAEHRIDLALIDLTLPKEDGLSLIKRLRQSHPDMGIIAISGRGSTLDRINGYQSGADIYLTKPVVNEELFAAVHALCRRLTRRTEPPAAGSARSIELDCHTLEVRGPAGCALLTTTEFALLSGLVRAKDRILETPLIYQMLGRDEGKKSALEALVYRVRRKLAQAGAGDNCIRAHRLKGYQLFCSVRMT